MDIYDEIGNLRALRDVGRALAQYTEALTQGRFQRRGNGWVYTLNFVEFRVHWKRRQHIVLTLRGNPLEFGTAFPELPLKRGRATYSRCTVSNARHLKAAAFYIARAYELWGRGRSRPLKRPVTTEV